MAQSISQRSAMDERCDDIHYKKSAKMSAKQGSFSRPQWPLLAESGLSVWWFSNVLNDRFG